MTAEHVRTLTERRDWLTARITAKRSVGWDTEYDTRERDALTWALNHLATDEAQAVLAAVADEIADYSWGQPVGCDLAAAIASYLAARDPT